MGGGDGGGSCGGGGPNPEVSSADCSPRQIPQTLSFPAFPSLPSEGLYVCIFLGIFGVFRLLSHTPIMPQARLLSRKTGFPMSLFLPHCIFRPSLGSLFLQVPLIHTEHQHPGPRM